MEIEDKDKKEYEIGVLVATEEDLAAVVALVRSHNGEISAEPRAKKMALAYEIKHHSDAVFAYFNFKASGSDVKELEHDMNTKPEVIRSLVVIATPPDTSAERASSIAGAAAANAASGGSSMSGMGGAMGAQRRPRSAPRSSSPSSAFEPKPAASQPLSNEALEKKIEEILK